MDIHLLGPVEATLDGRLVPLGTPKQRAVLAMLALQVNRTVSADRLIDGLWAERAPPTAPKMVQLYVSQLRKLLDGNEAEILTRGRGYELRLAANRVDAARFERLVAEAAGANGTSNGHARAALAMWRGDPLADVAHEPFAGEEIRRLGALRVEAARLAIESDIAAGRHSEVLPELRAMIAEEPLSERFRGQQMLALYRSGRQTEALEAYRDARMALVEAIGVEPGPELRRLHGAILHQAPELELPQANGLPAELDTTIPLVGREGELALLREHWQSARDGDGRVVLIIGEPGMGKTRLAAELAEEVLRDGGAVVFGAPEPQTAVRGPTLLVLDDVDDGADGRLAGPLPGPVLVVATAERFPPVVVQRATATLALEPLAADGVRAIAARYGRADVAVPVEGLLAASRGVPREAHRVSSGWARALDAQRLRQAAGRIAAERPALRGAEDELAGEIVRRQAEQERAEPLPAAPDAICPFKGLIAFDAGDAELFFGRERLVAELVARVTGTPLTGIVGPSGSGKSSVLQAGLVAALAGGVLPGSERWSLVLLRPGDHPLRALEEAVAGAPSSDRLVIAVDQFEETFTACRDESESAAFVDALVAAPRDPQRRTSVVLAVRADYYGRCTAYPELARLLGAGHALVGPMDADELRRAIVGPARRAGLVVEEALAGALVADLEGQPGALPLLSTSLLELWQRRDGRRLTLDAYARVGGVHSAVARLAEAAYARLDPPRRDVARRILLRLAGEGQGDAVVRRRVPVAELDAERDDDVAAVLRVLANDRLVTVAEDEVEVAHEALLREWPRLRGWLEEDAEGRRLHQHLIAAAGDWESSGRDPAELYRGSRSVTAAEWAQPHDAELNALEREFLAASRTEAEREAERRRRSNRRLRASLAGVATLLVLAVSAGGIALSQRESAQDTALAADAQRLGSEAQTTDELDHAILLARAGVALDDSAATRGSLLSAVQRSPALLGVLQTDGFGLYAAAVSPDQRLAAIGDERGTVTIFAAATRRRVGQYRIEDGFVMHLRFSPDGRTLAATGYEHTRPARAFVDLVEPGTGTLRRRIVLPPHPEPANYVETDVEFGADGRDLITIQVHEFPEPRSPASVLRRFDVRTGATRGRALRVGRHSSLTMTQTADRRSLFMTSKADDATYEVDARRLGVRHRYPVGDATGAVSPDGRRFALGSPEGGVRLLDLRTGRVRRFAGGHDQAIWRMTFAPDGRTLVTSDGDGTLMVWDVARGAIREELIDHEGGVEGLQIAPDGRSLVSAGNDGKAFLWDLAPDRRLDQTFDPGPPFRTDDGEQYPRGLAVSPDSQTLAIGQTSGRVDLIDARTQRVRRSIDALPGFAADVAYSPDGRLLAVTGERGRLALFDARTRQRIGELRGMTETSQVVVFSPNGRLLAAAENPAKQELGITDNTASRVRIWDVRRRAPTGFSIPVSSASLAFSPDGRQLAMATFSRGHTEIRDVRTRRLVTRLEAPQLVRSVAWSPRGDVVATGDHDGRGQLWSTKTWKRIGPPLEGHSRRLLELEFSPDGAVLSSAAADGTVRLWDVDTQRPLGSPLTIQADTFVGMAFSPDGSHLFAASNERRAISWNVEPAAWKRHACRVAGRELSRQEWTQALRDRPYRAVCATE